MSQKIITLPKQLANQIAAWEVVERPLSVVKELVENSIDAGATKIEVYLEVWGKEKIEVRDNGTGIAPEDMEKSLEKYSTSKITSLDDLYSVMTFGFRGEALASISSVSKFTLSSKTHWALSWKSITQDEYGLSTVSDIAMNEWTTITVEELFYNTPARLNYLKTERTEYSKIRSFIESLVLAYEHISFSLFHDGKQALHFAENMQKQERIHAIYGSEFHENMLELSHEFWWIKVSGYISDPKVSFPNKLRQLLFVNQRAITSPMISRAIIDAYNRFIAPKTYPWYVIFLDIDPTRVDVNVHPRKLEVRFADEQSVYRSIYHGIKNTLERVSLVSMGHRIPEFSSERNDTKTPLNKEEAPKYHISSGAKFKNYSPYTDTLPNPAQKGLDFTKTILWEKRQEFSAKLDTGDLRDTPMWRIVGQIHNSYIVIETEQWLKILDQHAVAERVIYEKISKSSYIAKSQWILWGIGFQVHSSELSVLEEYEEVFESLGFELDILSHGNIMIHAIPDFVSKNSIEKVVKNILSDISSVGSKSLEEIRHKIWAFTACRSAIKFWDPLTIFEMNALLRDASIEYSATCPHGRPVVYDISLDELQWKYER